MSSWRIKVYLLLQRLCPQHSLSWLAGWLAERKNNWLKNNLIRLFCTAYAVDLSQAERKEIDQYTDFNDFFTRSLEASARPIARHPNHLTAPADGILSAFGPLQDQQFVAAKGHQFSVAELCGDDKTGQLFANGSFATTYLGPADYHRVHFPCDATLVQMTFVPGQLYAVNPTTVTHMPNVLARNERIVCLLDTPHGRIAVVLIGAMIVGSMSTVWAGRLRYRSLHTETYNADAHAFQQGEELGQFMLGSCAIVLSQKPVARWSSNAGQRLYMGQALGHFDA
jgi:phosphatidylserine decarboxylase